MSKDNKLYYKLEHWAKVLLGVAALLIGFAFVAPYLLTRPAVDRRFNLSGFSGTADTIGGLMNPFVALAGVIITGLAFYMQYKANLIQRQLSKDAIDESKKQFKKQLKKQSKQHSIEQFENHFFEMLRLHKENVNEMEFEVSGRQYKGRSVFKYAVDEIHTIVDKSQLVYFYRANSKMPTETEVFPWKFHHAYNTFFWGDTAKTDYPFDGTRFSFVSGPVLHPDAKSWNAILGHYYRHLYRMVKYVVESQLVLKYKTKMRYLTILRAQLSNHEQIMLFYNWLTGFGTKWETESDSVNNQYFTRYRMIHNVWSKEVYQNAYILDTLVHCPVS